MNTEIEDAMQLKNAIKNGEVAIGGFVPASKYIALLNEVQTSLKRNFKSDLDNTVNIIDLEAKVEWQANQLKSYTTPVYEGIDTRNETMRLQDEKIKTLESKLTGVISSRECYQRGFSAGNKLKLDDHDIANLVNELNSIAKEYSNTEQLRSHISNCILGVFRNGK